MKVRRRSGPGATRRRERKKDSVKDALLARGAKATSGWKPASPSPRIVEEPKWFSDAARQIGQADPDDVAEHLRHATKAFLAGDHVSARAVFEAILAPIASVDIDLGQHELVEEVLRVDVRACVAQYAASVYTTTTLRERADAIIRALEQVQGVGTLSTPIKDMEDVCAGALPDLGTFLPRWVKRLERFRPSKDERDTEHERWLREAVFRMDGVGGLERIARKTRRPEACLAWYQAVADRGEWTVSLLFLGNPCRRASRSTAVCPGVCPLPRGTTTTARNVAKHSCPRHLRIKGGGFQRRCLLSCAFRVSACISYT